MQEVKSAILPSQKRRLLFPSQDREITELEKCFVDVNAQIINGIHASSPSSDHLLSEPHLIVIRTGIAIVRRGDGC